MYLMETPLTRPLVTLCFLLLACTVSAYYVSPGLFKEPLLQLNRTLSGLEEKTIQVAGHDIHYLEGGQGDIPIVLLHGIFAEKDHWTDFARALTGSHHILAPDLPGFGESSKPDASYDVGTQTERLAAFAKQLGIHKLHLIGNSMGGHIAALYAARHPEQVLSVALLDNAGITAPQKSEMFQRLERGEPNPLLVSQPEDFERMMSFLFVEQPSLPESLKQHFALRSIANHELNQKIFSQLRERYIPLEPELAKIQVPTLLLWGDQDRALDVSSIEVMKPLLKQPTVVIMKDCGHVPMIERPEETAAHYQAFLDSAKS